MATPRIAYEPIFAHLRSNNFHFSESWVIDCVDYFKSTKPGISVETLKNDVKQQWLLLNLRDIRVPSLPPDLNSKKVTIINGKFAVQVESMIDSSRSCYSHFQKLLKANPDHFEIKEEGEKSHRCLTFVISDGVQELHAMEYEIIKKIKTNDPKLRPGFKMIITGPVECRKGMILLKDQNISLCGGEIEALVITNSLKNLLIRRLELDPADYTEISSHIGEENEVPQTQLNEAVSVDNFDDGIVQSLLSQDDDVFFNVPFQPSHQEKQQADNFIDVEGVSHDIDIWSEGKLNQRNKGTNASERSHSQSVPQGSVLTARISQELHLEDNVPTQNLIEVDDDGDVIFEDYIEPQTKFQRTASKLRNPVQTKLSSFFKSSESNLNSAHRTSIDSEKPIFVSDKPFVYLKHIMSVNLTKPTTFTIKAIILTLRKKLTIEKDKYKLRAVITDGSSSVDVDFCSEILETFLGYSPCEMTVMIKTKQTNSAVGQRVKESFSKAQEKLISLNCLMEIKFFPDNTNPLILSLKEVTVQTLVALKERRLMDL